MSVGQEIINEDDLIVSGEELFTDAYGCVVGFGKRVHPRFEGLVHVFGIVFFDEYDRQIHEVSEHDSRSDAGGFDRYNPCCAFILKYAFELPGAAHSELRINLVVDEPSYEYDIAFGFADAITEYTLFEFFHYRWILSTLFRSSVVMHFFSANEAIEIY